MIMPKESEIRERFRKWREEKGYSSGYVSKLLREQFDVKIHRVSLWQFEVGQHGMKYDKLCALLVLLTKEGY